jgi:hypothetical protein
LWFNDIVVLFITLQCGTAHDCVAAHIHRPPFAGASDHIQAELLLHIRVIDYYHISSKNPAPPIIRHSQNNNGKANPTCNLGPGECASIAAAW